jgi:hypothetical protein
MRPGTPSPCPAAMWSATPTGRCTPAQCARWLSKGEGARSNLVACVPPRNTDRVFRQCVRCAWGTCELRARLSEAYRQVGLYAGCILNGVNPAVSGGPADQVQSHVQSQDREGARCRNSAEPHRARRSDRRIKRRTRQIDCRVRCRALRSTTDTVWGRNLRAPALRKPCRRVLPQCRACEDDRPVRPATRAETRALRRYAAEWCRERIARPPAFDRPRARSRTAPLRTFAGPYPVKDPHGPAMIRAREAQRAGAESVQGLLAGVSYAMAGLVAIRSLHENGRPQERLPTYLNSSSRGFSRPR